MGGSRTSVTRLLIVLWTLVVLAFLYLPMVSVVLASFTK
jgi:ABC-type spermidine/putrescine transport system permease subunit II